VARHVVIEVDNREKNPVLFPSTMVWSHRPFERTLVKVEVRRRELPLGDYRLANYPRCCVVERKSGLTELCQNLLSPTDRARFQEAWNRFVTGCRYPVLLLDGALASADTLKFKTEKIIPEDVMSAFWSLMLWKPPTTVVWAGPSASVSTRTKLGAQLLTLMLAAASRESN
jgi:ERCC4-type nuclease